MTSRLVNKSDDKWKTSLQYVWKRLLWSELRFSGLVDPFTILTFIFIKNHRIEIIQKIMKLGTADYEQNFFCCVFNMDIKGLGTNDENTW